MVAGVVGGVKLVGGGASGVGVLWVWGLDRWSVWGGFWVRFEDGDFVSVIFRWFALLRGAFRGGCCVGLALRTRESSVAQQIPRMGSE